MIEDPTPVFFDVRGVYAPKSRLLGDPIAGDVIDDSAIFVAQQPVLDLPRFKPRQAAAEEPIGDGDRIRSLELDLAHVGDVEQSSGFADRAVFCADGRVLDGQLVAAKFDHAPPQAPMDVEEGRSLQRCHSPVRAR